ncbi:MAG: hypothetical protein E6J70_13985, partial [Deltaproteobacteria bacterium]
MQLPRRAWDGLLVGVHRPRGREVTGKRLKNFACFALFVSEYMQYDLGGQAQKVYDTFRNGLAHEFAIKGKGTAVATRIYT